MTYKKIYKHLKWNIFSLQSKKKKHIKGERYLMLEKA